MDSTTNEHADVPRIVVLGIDATLGVRPSTPVQLAHACLLAGYALAVPSTWGDELVAEECVRQLAGPMAPTMVLCSCPLVRRRLLAHGAELAEFMVSTVAPPVATARYVRALASKPVRVHFVGRCPSGGDPSIDRWIDPDDFIAMLDQNGIDVATQPTSFEGVLPPDRRRHWSLPGGFPAADPLWDDGGRRERVEPDPEQDLSAAVAELLLEQLPRLIDLGPAMHCACSGVVTGVPARTARARVELTEPPRSPAAVVDHSLGLELAEPVDVPPPVERIELPPHPFRPSGPMPHSAGETRRIDLSQPPDRRTIPGIRLTNDTSGPRQRSSGAMSVRPSPTSVPVSRQSDGRLVPRAYAARRRATPPGGTSSREPGGSTRGEQKESGESDNAGDVLEGHSPEHEPRPSPALGITAPAGD